MSERIWHLAVCMDCQPVLPQPFTDKAERDDWFAKHTEATGHQVIKMERESDD